MVMFIISALFCLPLIILAGMGISENMVRLEDAGFKDSDKILRPKNYTLFFCYAVQIFVGLVEVVVAISASVFSYHAFSSGK